MKFRIFDVKIELQFFAVAILTAVFLLDKNSKISLCLLCALIHEIGHIAAMLLFSVKPESITFRAFDIVIIDNGKKTDVEDFFITLAGPLTNLFLACIFYFFSKSLFWCNISLCVFNLLPVETFDGGHALFILLSKKLSLKSSVLTLRIFTLCLLIPFFAVGIFVLISSKYNYSLLLISLYLLAILFIK